jgi:hypothetical protein
LLTNIENVPYFVFYLFIKKAIKSEKQFDSIKPLLANYFADRGQQVDFKFGYNHQERVKYIASRLNLAYEILDVGCGEYIYYRRITKMGYDKAYHAIDEEQEFEQMAQNMMLKLNTDNLKYYANVADFESIYNNQPLEIILTEVIEHNSEAEAKKLIEHLLKLNFSKFFISTPNKDFNIHYFENPDDMRHHDHDFEMTSEEFSAFMNQFKQPELELSFDQIGDSIDGVCPTQICIISKIQKHA